MATSKKKTKKKTGSSKKRRQNKGEVTFTTIVTMLLGNDEGFVSAKDVMKKLKEVYGMCPDPLFGQKEPLKGRALLSHIQTVVTTAARIAVRKGNPVRVVWDTERQGFARV
jgi:hypothetical protein